MGLFGQIWALPLLIALEILSDGAGAWVKWALSKL